MNNIYTKNESDDKYLNKDSNINEFAYSRTDIKISSNLKASFWFNDLTVEVFRVGIVFSYYDTSSLSGELPIITNKYSFVDVSDREVYMSEDESIRLFIIHTNSTAPNNTPIYNFVLIDILNNNPQITTYSKNEWYIETGNKFDSTKIYCKEIVDELIKQT